MNPFCPHDKHVLKLTRESWKCPECGSKWRKGDVIRNKIGDVDLPILFLRKLFG